eukprot:TRINITY_DN1123_c0_g3_i1.p1 TRINITY_DN1123_c0_g3~~TRINITY_DN1123_c0_g3_i1.p1  ORF type:complete len:345 (+),score=61.08 TRINITY_DN1123_c0_g3_i1:47-1036(+)
MHATFPQRVAVWLALLCSMSACFLFMQSRTVTGDASFEVSKFDVMEVPSLVVFTDASPECAFKLKTCYFSSQGEFTDCKQAITNKNYGGQVSLLNATVMRKLGIFYSSPLDMLSVQYSLTFITNGTKATPQACNLLSHGRNTELSKFVIPVGDTNVLEAIDNDDHLFDMRRLGAPAYIGYGMMAHFTFSLEQELLRGPSGVKNTTIFGVSQLPKHLDRDAMEFRISAASFNVRRIVHKEGQSLIDLMGGVFLFTAVCCLFALLLAKEAAKKRHNCLAAGDDIVGTETEHAVVSLVQSPHSCCENDAGAAPTARVVQVPLMAPKLIYYDV